MPLAPFFFGLSLGLFVIVTHLLIICQGPKILLQARLLPALPTRRRWCVYARIVLALHVEPHFFAQSPSHPGGHTSR